MQVIALIGDIVASKELPQRGVFQRRLDKVLADAGANANHLASPYTVTLGDEFQAVYRKADLLFADVFTIMAGIHPVRARIAVGVGALTTRINPTQALGMDGPSFHVARAALGALKQDRRFLRIGGEPGQAWALANHVLNLISHQVEGWSANRLRIMAGLLRGLPVKQIEEGLQISRVAVYKNIHAAALDDVAGICHELEREMNQALRSS
jgi:hypothetical protein